MLFHGRWTDVMLRVRICMNGSMMQGDVGSYVRLYPTTMRNPAISQCSLFRCTLRNEWRFPPVDLYTKHKRFWRWKFKLQLRLTQKKGSSRMFFHFHSLSLHIMANGTRPVWVKVFFDLYKSCLGVGRFFVLVYCCIFWPMTAARTWVIFFFM